MRAVLIWQRLVFLAQWALLWDPVACQLPQRAQKVAVIGEEFWQESSFAFRPPALLLHGDGEVVRGPACGLPVLCTLPVWAMRTGGGVAGRAEGAGEASGGEGVREPTLRHPPRSARARSRVSIERLLQPRALRRAFTPSVRPTASSRPAPCSGCRAGRPGAAAVGLRAELAAGPRDPRGVAVGDHRYGGPVRDDAPALPAASGERAQPAAMTAARLTAAGSAWAKRMRRLAVAAPYTPATTMQDRKKIWTR